MLEFQRTSVNAERNYSKRTGSGHACMKITKEATFFSLAEAVPYLMGLLRNTDVKRAGISAAGCNADMHMVSAVHLSCVWLSLRVPFLPVKRLLREVFAG